VNILIHTIASPYSTDRVGGAETSLRLLAEKLTKNGHTVSFFSKSQKKSLTGIRKEKINGVKVYFLSKFYNPLNVYQIDKLAKLRHDKFIEHHLISNKIDIVHTYYNLSLSAYYLKLRDSGLYNFKLVIRIAGMRWLEQIKTDSEKKIEFKQIFEGADLLNFISEGLYTLFTNGLIKAKMDVSFHNYFIKDIGISFEDIQKRSKQATNRNFVCTMVSRFTDYQKRQDLLVDAMVLLPKNIPIKLRLIGSGPTKKLIEQKIALMNLESKIEVIEFLPQKVLWEKIGETDLLCHACDYEGLGKIIIESMGMGLTVLASNVLPLKSYIKDGQNGFLVDNDPTAWAEKIKYLYDKQDDLENIGSNARVFIKKEFDANENIEVYINEFENLIF